MTDFEANEDLPRLPGSGPQDSREPARDPRPLPQRARDSFTGHHRRRPQAPAGGARIARPARSVCPRARIARTLPRHRQGRPGCRGFRG